MLALYLNTVDFLITLVLEKPGIARPNQLRLSKSGDPWLIGDFVFTLVRAMLVV